MKSKTISRDLLDPDPNQPRRTVETEDVKQLARSVHEMGQLQPIIVFCNEKGRFTIVDGHRRFAASKLARVETLFALVLDARPDKDTLLLTQLAANCMRVDLKPTEKALAFQRLKESRGWSSTELASAMHVSKAMVTRVLSYLQLPPEAKERLDAGELSGSTAYAITRAPDPATKNNLIDEAVNGKLKRDDAQRRVERSGATRRIRAIFQIQDAEVTVATTKQLDLQLLVKLWQRLGRECRKGIKDGLDPQTLARVLASKRRTEAKQ